VATQVSLGTKRVSVCRAVSATLTMTLLLAVMPACSREPAPQRIMPGVGIGPAQLGMAERDARRALVMAGLETSECTVDILAHVGRVIALGTRFGGCLELPLPRSTVWPKVINGVALPEVGGIGGSSHPLIRAFGPPTRLTINALINVLLWPNGLVARTALVADDEAVTYLAVVPPHTAIPPYSLLSVTSDGRGRGYMAGTCCWPVTVNPKPSLSTSRNTHRSTG
jgi:hypothetical protein